MVACLRTRWRRDWDSDISHSIAQFLQMPYLPAGWGGMTSSFLRLALVGTLCVLLASGVVAPWGAFIVSWVGIGVCWGHRDLLVPLTWLHLLFVSCLSTSRRASEIPLSPYQSPFPWEAPGTPGEVLRVMKQNLHHSESNFPSFVAKNSVYSFLLAVPGFSFGASWEPLAPLSLLPC